MNLTGGRTTLILNICALILALIISIENTYITYNVYGWLPHWSVWAMGFAPMLVMLIVRNKWFSGVFLFLHVVVAVHGFALCRTMYLGEPYWVDPKSPVIPTTALFLVSLLSLAAYGIVVLLSSTALALLHKPKPPVVSNRD